MKFAKFLVLIFIAVLIAGCSQMNYYGGPTGPGSGDEVQEGPGSGDEVDTSEPTGPGSGDEITNEPTGPGIGDEIDPNEPTGPGSGDEVTDEPTGPGSGDEVDPNEPTGPGSGDEITEEPTGPGSGDEIDPNEPTGPGSGDEITEEPTGPGSGDELTIRASCNAISKGSTCIEYIGSFWAILENTTLNCTGAGTHSTDPCPRPTVGGCHVNAGTAEEIYMWHYDYGGDPFTPDVVPYAAMVCNANPVSSWVGPN